MTPTATLVVLTPEALVALLITRLTIPITTLQCLFGNFYFLLNIFRLDTKAQTRF